MARQIIAKIFLISGMLSATALYPMTIMMPKSKLLNFAPAILRACTKKGRKAFGDLIYVPLPCDTDEEVEVQHD